jgi:antitoxin HicB
METPKALQATPQEILKLPYERVLIPEEEGGFSAYISEFEGCVAQGETADEALTALQNTAVVWLEAELEAGKEIPEPWNLQEFSGKLLLRLPKSLHQQLARMADKERVSLNQYLVSRLSATNREDVLFAAWEKRLEQVQPPKNQFLRAVGYAEVIVTGTTSAVVTGDNSAWLRAGRFTSGEPLVTQGTLNPPEKGKVVHVRNR